MSTKHIYDYDSFVNENAQSASVFNTPGMGNVTVSGTGVNLASSNVDTGDQDKIAKHLRMHERGHNDDSWMRPSSDYSNRNWLVPNYEMYQNQRQSNANFQIGESVRCIDPMKESYGKIGKIVAFEDNTIRWELAESEVGVGQTSKQYRCHASHLMKINIIPGVA